MAIKRLYDTLVGATVNVNQLCNSSSVTVPNGHKYYMIKGGTASIGASTGTAITGLTSGTDIVINLTQMFGSTIADYLYNLETATAGAGIAKLLEWGFFTEGYIPYNPGALESVEARSHVMRGFNQWDEEWELGLIAVATGADVAGNGIRSKNMCRCVPNTVYNANIPYAYTKYIFWYDSAGNFISSTSIPDSGSVTSPSNAYYFRIGIDTITTYNHDICINLSSDRNGEYEPYTEQTYDLGTDTLRGLFKLDSNNNLYADGDTKASDGTVTRQYKEVTYDGSEAWVKDRDVNGYNRYYIADNSVKKLNNYTGSIVASKGDIGSTYAFAEISLGNIAISAYSIAGTLNYVYFGLKTSLNISTLADFKAWLASNPVDVLLPLATPTTEQSTPFQNPQICDPDGTEEYVTSNGVPVGHETRYQL